MNKDTPGLYQDTAKKQSFGAIVAIIVVLSMIIIGAFYAFKKHEQRTQYLSPHTTNTTTR